MKKTFFLTVIMIGALFVSCNSDDPTLEVEESSNLVVNRSNEREVHPKSEIIANAFIDYINNYTDLTIEAKTFLSEVSNSNLENEHAYDILKNNELTAGYVFSVEKRNSILIEVNALEHISIQSNFDEVADVMRSSNLNNSWIGFTECYRTISTGCMTDPPCAVAHDSGCMDLGF